MKAKKGGKRKTKDLSAKKAGAVKGGATPQLRTITHK
jgi:hypothetical protein